MAPGSPGPFKRSLHWLHGFGAHWGSPCGKGTGRGAEVSPHHWRPAGSPWMGCGEVVFLGRLHPLCACPQDSGSAWLQGGTVGSAEGEQAGLVGRGACPRPLPSLARCAWSHLGRRLCPERRCWGPAFPYEGRVAGGEQRPGASVESAPASGAFRSLQRLHRQSPSLRHLWGLALQLLGAAQTETGRIHKSCSSPSPLATLASVLPSHLHIFLLFFWICPFNCYKKAVYFLVN